MQFLLSQHDPVRPPANNPEETSEALDYGYGYEGEFSVWESLWYAVSGWLSLAYVLLLIWMVVYCVKHDPERSIWLWIILIFWPLGPFIYFIARWLPSAEIRLPAFTHRWTKSRELRRLETAAIQIGNAHQHVQYGDALKAVGMHTEALQAYLNALDRDETLAALWGAGSMEYRLEKYSAAKDHLEKILKTDPAYKFGDVSLLYGKALIALNQKQDALAHLQTHTQKWRQPEAMYLLGKLYVEIDEKSQAQNALQNLILDLDSSPKAIARKHLFWKSRAKRLLRRL